MCWRRMSHPSEGEWPTCRVVVLWLLLLVGLCLVAFVVFCSGTGRALETDVLCPRSSCFSVKLWTACILEIRRSL